MNNHNNHRKGTASVAFMIGAIAGGVTALLLAPQSGPQLRRRLREGAGGLKDGAREKASAVKGALVEAKNTYKDELEKRRPLETEQVARRTGA